MKITLKQKIALSLISASGLAAVFGMTLAWVASDKKFDAIESYKTSAEYKTTIAEELLQAEEQYNSKGMTVEALGEYYDAVSKIYSIDHADALLQKSNSEYKRPYNDSQKMTSAAILTVIGAGIGFIGGCSCSIELITGKKKEEETLSK